MTKSKKSSSLMSYAGTFGALVILCVVLAIASPNFFKYSNMMSVLKQTSFNALVSTGMLLCLITAGIDLSVGANATFAACLAGMLVNKGMNNPVLLLVVCHRWRHPDRLDQRYASYPSAPAASVRIYPRYEERTVGRCADHHQLSDGILLR